MVTKNRIKQVYNASGTRIEKLLKLENAWDEHMLFGFVPYECVTSGAGSNAENVPFIPSYVQEVQIWVDGKALFSQGGISWNNTTDNKRQMYE